MVEPKTNPMLQAAFANLAEVGPTWTTAQRDEWCGVFAQMVAMVYPGRKPRVRRAKGGAEPKAQV